MTLFIDYENEDFPTGILPNVQRRLDVSWDEFLWAAITVGRPDVFHVFQHGQASFHEAIFRWSMVRMALQQRGGRGQKFVRTELFKQMDPTEKGAVNYFLGLVTCKLFAWKLLKAPWTIHLDVFRSSLNPRVLSGRSRPDMVAQSANGDWYAFECKGRASVPGEKEKQKAKAQALRLVSVGGTTCTLHIGAITFFKNDAVEFFWRDPEPTPREGIELPTPDFAWRDYYSPFVEVMRGAGGLALSGQPDAGLTRVEQLDLAIAIHPSIKPLLIEANWQAARILANELRHAFVSDGFQPDGLKVRAGESWLERFAQAETR